jgi:hypothetical protein
MMKAPIISFSSISLLYYSLFANTNYDALHYASLSNLIVLLSWFSNSLKLCSLRRRKTKLYSHKERIIIIIIWRYKHMSSFYLLTLLFLLLSIFFFFNCFFQPIQGPGLLFSSVIILSQTVGLLGRVISPSQGCYLNTGQHKHRINAYAQQTSMPWVRFEPTIPASERASERRSSCLRPRGYCDRLSERN